MKTQPPILFWIIAALLAAWSLADLAVLFIDYSQTGIRTSGVVIDVFEPRPLWYKAVMIFSVTTGVIAAVCILWRNKIAVTFAICSFVAVLIDLAYPQIQSGAGSGQVFNWELLSMIVFFDLVLIILAFYSKRQGWIS